MKLYYKVKCGTLAEYLAEQVYTNKGIQYRILKCIRGKANIFGIDTLFPQDMFLSQTSPFILTKLPILTGLLYDKGK